MSIILNGGLKSYVKYINAEGTEVIHPVHINVPDEPLIQLYNRNWASYLNSHNIRNTIENDIHKHIPGAYNFKHYIPSNGILFADLFEITVNSEKGKRLILTYKLFGFSTSFNFPNNIPWADRSFDTVVNISCDVIQKTTLFFPSQSNSNIRVESIECQRQNQSCSLDTVFHNFSFNLDNFGSAIEDFKNNDIVQGLNNNPTDLNFAYSRGFTGRDITITNQNFLSGTDIEISIYHKRDPAPTIVNDLVSNFPSFTIPPSIVPSLNPVNIGKDLRITGSSFGIEQFDLLSFSWNDTTSGDIQHTEIEWGHLDNGETVPKLANISNKSYARNPNDGKNKYILHHLKQNSRYAIRVRDYDNYIPNQPQFCTCTDWQWKILSTRFPQEILITLESQTHQSTFLGHVTIDETGGFNLDIVVPNVPSGDYKLVATNFYRFQRPVHNPPIAVYKYLKISNTHDTLLPVIHIINPYNEQFIMEPVAIMESYPQYVQGQNFAPNKMANLKVDNDSGELLKTVTTDNNGKFKTQIIWPSLHRGQSYQSVLFAKQGTLETRIKLDVVQIPH